MFSTTPFTRFYTIKSTGEANVTKLNMFKVDKELRVFERISEDFQNKSWTIEVRTASQGQKLLELKTFVSEPITVTPHEHHNQSQGVITCPLLKGYTNEEVTEGLSDHGIIDCRRIIRNPKYAQPEPTASLILTFNSATLPDRISIRTGLTDILVQSAAGPSLSVSGVALMWRENTTLTIVNFR